VIRAALRTLLALALWPSAFATLAPGALEVSGSWVRETPPNRTVAAGYLVLRNGGETAATLVGAESAAARIELHTMLREDGMMRMRPMEQLVIPAGESAALAPGGDHLMLFDVDATRAGTVIEVELLFDDGARLPVALPVRRQAPEGD
jgi:copper(I)-binding protein